MKRDKEDFDGMLDDIRQTYYSHSKSELIDIIMDLNHNEQSDDDLLEDWINFCNGEIIDDSLNQYKDELIALHRDK